MPESPSSKVTAHRTFIVDELENNYGRLETANAVAS
jgi:hypothetical protein